MFSSSYTCRLAVAVLVLEYIAALVQVCLNPLPSLLFVSSFASLVYLFKSCRTESELRRLFGFLSVWEFLICVERWTHTVLFPATTIWHWESRHFHLTEMLAMVCVLATSIASAECMNSNAMQFCHVGLVASGESFQINEVGEKIQ